MRLFIIVFTTFLCLLFNCSKPSKVSGKVDVVVSIAPQKYFVEKIGKDYVNITTLVPPGASPHSYEPRPSQMAQLSRSKVYFTIGIEFEKAWLPRIQMNSKFPLIVATDSGVPRIAMVSHIDHDEGEQHEEHEDGGLDPHIWLSPELVKIQAKNILQGLIAADSLHKDYYKANYDEFLTEISQLQGKIKAVLSNCPQPIPFMIFHPAWGYFAKEFNCLQIPIEIEGKEPSPKEMVTIITIARDKNIKTIFIQPQLSPRSAEQIAHEIGGQTAVANDLAEDWADNLLQFADKIGKCK